MEVVTRRRIDIMESITLLLMSGMGECSTFESVRIVQFGINQERYMID